MCQAAGMVGQIALAQTELYLGCCQAAFAIQVHARLYSFRAQVDRDSVGGGAVALDFGISIGAYGDTDANELPVADSDKDADACAYQHAEPVANANSVTDLDADPYA